GLVTLVTRRCGLNRDGSLFAGFILSEIVANRNTDLFQCLLSNPRNLFQLLGSHVGERFYSCDAGSDQLLDDVLAQFADLLDGRRRTTTQALHLLLNFLALLFLALDVDLPGEKLRGKPHILALLTDSK